MSEPAYYAHIFFSGHVQGVGFRYQTRQVALGFEVSGYVRNLADGRVEMEAEGREEEVNAFVANVKKHLVDYIRSTADETGHRSPRFKGFEIK